MIRIVTADKTLTADSVDTHYVGGVAWLVADGVTVCRWSDVQSIELA